MIRRILIVLLPLVIVAAAVAVLANVLPGRGELAHQPIEFNHKIHLERVQGIECQNCHLFATSQHFAGIPGKQLCFGCHDPTAEEEDSDAKKPKFAKLMSFATTEDEIPWHRVTASRRDVFFSHRRHFQVGKVECRVCHTDVPDRTSPPTDRLIEMSMDTCIHCHEVSEVSVDCIACHR